MKLSKLFCLLGFLVSCNGKPQDDFSVSEVSIDSSSNVVMEHTSYQNDDSKGMMERSYTNASLYAEMKHVSVFNTSVKQKVAEYLLSHLKKVKNLRMLGVSHHYFLNTHTSSYYVTYFKNNSTKVAYGCKLNRKLNDWRIEYQHVHADKEDFRKKYNLHPNSLSNTSTLKYPPREN